MSQKRYVDMTREEQLAYGRKKAKDNYAKNRERESAKRAEYYRNKQARDPHYKEIKHKYFQSHRKKWSIVTTRSIQKCREFIIMQLGGKCVYCGCDDIPRLQINHKNGDGSKEPKGRGAAFYWAILKGRRTTEDLEVTCPICNWVHYMGLLGYTGWVVKWN